MNTGSDDFRSYHPDFQVLVSFARESFMEFVESHCSTGNHIYRIHLDTKAQTDLDPRVNFQNPIQAIQLAYPFENHSHVSSKPE